MSDSDQFVSIEVDGKTMRARKGSMLIETTDAANVDIPRFCYHKKLSVASNCRMCLVEVEKAPKPLPACSTPVMEGMKVFTKSNLAKEAQKSVMEFLLINHPLDCPICDQGGECELQDLAVGYGSDVSRYSEQKRVVKDKNIGPLIQTDLTRCIHCTRCVRFGEEVAGMREMGATGRGENMQIGTYIEKAVTSELSGNIIDLCPVGALTSKPYRYTARAWELRQHDSIAPHDAVGSNVHLHVKGNTVKRVVPKENEAVNEVWISDRDRFSYEGLNSEKRLQKPMIKVDHKWQETDWDNALEFAVAGLKKIIPTKIGALASPTNTLEELFLFQKLMRGMGCGNIDHRQRQVDFSDQNDLPIFPWLGQNISDLEDLSSVLLIGSNVRQELPLINHRLRMASEKGAEIFVINPVDFDFNWQSTGSVILPPSEIESVLSGVAKVLLDKQNSNQEIDDETTNSLKDIEPTREQKIIAESLRSNDQSAIFLGHIAASIPNANRLRTLSNLIAKLSDAKLGYFPEAANTCGAWLAGAVPHRQVGGREVDKVGLDARTMFEQGMRGYVLLGTEPELDSLTSVAAVESLKAAEFVVSLFGFRSEIMMDYADVILPIGLFAETSGTFVNLEGRWQSFSGAVKPKNEARPAWKILRVLGNKFDLEGFDYDSSLEVLDEIKSLSKEIEPDNRMEKISPREIQKSGQGIELVFETPIYFTDPLVRRAKALQQMQDVEESVLQINSDLADQLRIDHGEHVRVRQGELAVELKCLINNRVPSSCALWQRGHKPEPDFGLKPGEFALEKIS
ncbi:MAG: NADH-quinone oxidoreductase subunit NuoG [Gammaproteobacteria bacterium]